MFTSFGRFQVEMLQAYDGDVDKLGNAEKFFYSLIKLQGYKLRIETMILKGDFNSQLGAIRPNIQTLSTVCRKLIDNESLQVFLRFVLHAGNFINGVSFRNIFVFQLRKYPCNITMIYSFFVIPRIFLEDGCIFC